MAIGQARARWQRWWPFGLLVVAGASRWMLEGVWPGAAATLGSEAVGCAWAALVLLLGDGYGPRRPGEGRGAALRGREPRAGRAWRMWLAGALLLGGPASALLIGGAGVDAGSLTIALALTPVAVAIAAAALGTGRGAGRADGVAGQIWPGLAAVAGLLLVLTQPSVGDGRSDMALLLAPALTGVGAALFCAEASEEARRGQPADPGLRGETLRQAQGRLWGTRRMAMALGGGVALFAVALGWRWLAAGARPAATLTAVACDGLMALLGVVALERLGATRWSAQFALLPLLILLEGLALVRPGVTARWLVGLALLALASVYLLLPAAEEPEEEPALVPR